MRVRMYDNRNGKWKLKYEKKMKWNTAIRKQEFKRDGRSGPRSKVQACCIVLYYMHDGDDAGWASRFAVRLGATWHWRYDTNV